MTATNCFFVFLGGGLGSLARYGVASIFSQLGKTGYPYATFVTNIMACLILGAVVELFAARLDLPHSAKLFMVTGILGGFSTFSTFILETTNMIDDGRFALGVAYLSLSIVAGVLALYGGMMIGRQL